MSKWIFLVGTILFVANYQAQGCTFISTSHGMVGFSSGTYIMSNTSGMAGYISGNYILNTTGVIGYMAGNTVMSIPSGMVGYVSGNYAFSNSQGMAGYGMGNDCQPEVLGAALLLLFNNVEAVDGASSSDHVANINPAPEVFANAERDLVHQTLDPFTCSTPTCNDTRLDVPLRPLGQTTEAQVKMPHGKVFTTEGPYTSGGQIIFKFGMKKKSESNANGNLFTKKSEANDNNPYNLP